MRWNLAALARLAAQGACAAVRIDNSLAHRDTSDRYSISLVSVEFSMQ
jgi:hypothetical protein